jgi:ABC-type branched-subunit amino acid transport system permease subunit
MGPEHLTHAVGLASDMAIMSLLALSAYLLLIVGRISFGQQAFFGIGAYASALASVMAQWPLLPALLLGAVVAALASLALALPTMRLAGLNYAVATLAFGEMVRIALQSGSGRSSVTTARSDRPESKASAISAGCSRTTSRPAATSRSSRWCWGPCCWRWAGSNAAGSARRCA